MSEVLAFLKRWASWIVGSILLASAVIQTKAAKERARKYQRALADKEARGIEILWGDIDRDRLAKSQENSRKANERLLKRVDQVAEGDDDVDRIFDSWNSRRLRDNTDSA